MQTQPIELRRLLSSEGRELRLTRPRVFRSGINENRGTLSNYGVNATVRPVTARACARTAPVRPARYALRYAAEGVSE